MANQRHKQLKQSKARQVFERCLTVLMIIGIVVGLGLAITPSLQDYMLYRKQQAAIAAYNHADKRTPMQTYLSKFYKQQRAATTSDLFKGLDDSQNATSKHSVDVAKATLKPIATLSIPSIKVVLPVYGNSGAEALDNGAGVVPGTGDLLGGKGKHAAIAGHSGKNARLFTDLLKVKSGKEFETKQKNKKGMQYSIYGKKFFIRVNGEIHAYKVDKISTVTPDDVSQLKKVPKKDYITLITCTPLGSSAYRLLVRGHRVKYVPKENTGDRGGLTPLGRLVLTASALIGGMVIVFVSYRLILRYRQRRNWHFFD
ncbi:sortase [Lactiplantibacillus plantarum]|uniref:sortase n=1 Tax=Lactiplantibacillus plantarum TaxID=1590 RepID=UPI0021A799AC|nr:sortase [Lactiplantibacillus plantarum]MCT3206470.1 class C sortase [Lactiplantibacillus plantarum]MCT3220186.1 class C sortase [Lactiplantibacillus plantarum]MCT3281538.1 class C sortase [Lactiplantibacillus plantarum]